MQSIHRASTDALLAVLRNALERVSVIVVELDVGDVPTAHLIAADLEIDLEAAINETRPTPLGFLAEAA